MPQQDSCLGKVSPSPLGPSGPCVPRFARAWDHSWKSAWSSAPKRQFASHTRGKGCITYEFALRSSCIRPAKSPLRFCFPCFCCYPCGQESRATPQTSLVSPTLVLTSTVGLRDPAPLAFPEVVLHLVRRHGGASQHPCISCASDMFENDSKQRACRNATWNKLRRARNARFLC